MKYQQSWGTLNRKSLTPQDLLTSGLGLVIMILGAWQLVRLITILGVWALNPDLGWGTITEMVGY